MREIKFRAWHRELKVMLTAYVIDQTLHSPITPNEPSDYYEHTCKGFYGDNNQIQFRYHEVDWLQYTGLKDKNGTEIYEGDIVTTNYPTVKNMADAWLVEYGHTGMFQMAVGSFKQSIHELVYNDWKLEVIGNIYDNPELLKERVNE